MAAVLEVLVGPAGRVHSHTGHQLKQKAREVACSNGKPQHPLALHLSQSTQQPCGVTPGAQ